MDNTKETKTEKVYFDSEIERDSVNAAEALYRGCDMVYTVYWYPYGQDENGFYLLVNDWV